MWNSKRGPLSGAPLYSPIAPVEMLIELRKMGLVSNYLLVLPHDVVRNPASYRELLKTKICDAEEVGEWIIILDNGAAEIAKGEVNYKDINNLMLEAYEIVRPNIICLNDVIGDPTASLIASGISHHDWEERLWNTYSVQAGVDYEWMAIPQGNTTGQTLEAARKMALWSHVNYWGIPRNLTNTCGSRVPIVDRISRDVQLNSRRDMHLNKPIHLLGMSNCLLDDIEAASYPNVMGIDSANPLVLGYNDVRISKEYANATVHLPRLDYWSNIQVSDLICDNICVIQELLADAKQRH